MGSWEYKTAIVKHPGTNNNRKPLQSLEFKEPGERKVLVKPREIFRKRSLLSEAVSVGAATDRATARPGRGWGSPACAWHWLESIRRQEN